MSYNRRNFLMLMTVAMMFLAVVVLQKKPLQKNADSGNRIVVVAASYPAYLALKEVATDAFSVLLLQTPVQNGDEWQFSDESKKMLKSSRALFFINRSLEKYEEKIDGSLVGRDNKIELGKDVLLRQTVDEENDPYFYLDPLDMATAISTAKEALVKLSPDDKKQLVANEQNALLKLSSLDTKLKKMLSNCQQKSVVIAQDQLYYLSKRYGFGYYALSKGDTSNGISLKSAAFAARFIKESKARYLLCDFGQSQSVISSFAEENGVEMLPFYALSSMPNKKVEEDAYTTWMQKNGEALSLAMKCGK